MTCSVTENFFYGADSIRIIYNLHPSLHYDDSKAEISIHDEAPRKTALQLPYVLFRLIPKPVPGSRFQAQGFKSNRSYFYLLTFIFLLFSFIFYHERTDFQYKTIFNPRWPGYTGYIFHERMSPQLPVVS